MVVHTRHTPELVLAVIDDVTCGKDQMTAEAGQGARQVTELLCINLQLQTVSFKWQLTAYKYTTQRTQTLACSCQVLIHMCVCAVAVQGMSSGTAEEVCCLAAKGAGVLCCG